MTLPSRDQVEHSPGRPQGWLDADEELRGWVRSVVESLGSMAGAVAVFLHGSLAMGSFYRPKSDVDVLVVVENPLGEAARRSLSVDLLRLHELRPIIGGLELSVITRSAAESFVHPLPYELHFSEIWCDQIRGGGAGPHGHDPDLAAHCTMTRARGLALIGPEPTTLLGEVPHEAYLAAVLDDTEWILNGGITESPFYGVLNLCRSLQLVLENPAVPPSKDEAAEWALATLPAQHRAIIAMATDCHRSSAVVPVQLRRVHGHDWEPQPLLDFVDHVRDRLRSAGQPTQRS